MSGGFWRGGVALALAGTVLSAGCGESPTSPGPPVVTPPTPPPANTAPVIKGITLGASRAEVGQSISVVADVQDAETPVANLTYEWSASAGTITGTGRSVSWSLAQGAANTPANVVLTLTVVEPYQALVGNQIVTQQHRVSATSGVIRAHDSKAELSEMVLRFLIDYFGDSTVSPDACLVDFSDSCSGKDAEHEDIVDNRRDVVILSAEATIQSVTLNGAFSTADILAPCEFKDIVKATQEQRTATGTCRLTGVYEQQRWWICSSNFDPAPSGGPPASDVTALRRSGYR